MPDHIPNLKFLTGKSIKEVPYLGDMFFSFDSSIIHRDNFIVSYERLAQFIEKKLDEFLSKKEELDEHRAEIILGGAVPPIHFFLPLDSLITCVKRTLDFSMRFTIKLLLNREYKYLSIHRLSKCFMNRNKGLHDINGEFENNFPGFRLRFLNEWDMWMKDINDIRDNVLHSFIIKEGAFDLRYFRDRNKDMSFIQFTGKELENPHEFVKSVMKRFTEYFTWIIRYNLQQLSKKIFFLRHEKFGKVIANSVSWDVAGRMKCRDSRFCNYFLSENKYWCYLKKMYVEPEQPNCDEFEHPIREPLDKYI